MIIIHQSLIMYLSRIIFSLTFFLSSLHCYSQNLFANPGFEDINNCVEYHADCAPEAWFNIPAANYLVKGRLAQKPVLGNMLLLVPVSTVLQSMQNKRRFVYTMLTCPLVTGEKYKLSFFINTAGKPFEKLDFWFTEKEPALNNFNVSGRSPAFTLTEKDIDTDFKMGWKHVLYEFTAAGAMQFCVLGNFSPLQYQYEMKDAMNSSGDIFYFIDEISLKPLSNIPLCEGYNENIKKMYAQDYRHTDNITVIKDTPVGVRPAYFTTDTITIPAVLYDVNNALLKPAISKILDSIIDKTVNSMIAKIEINGHTDNSGSFAKNETLSLQRAEGVKKYLTDRMPQMAEKIFVFAKGQQFPVANNATEAGRKKNRRVEIIITTVKLSNK